MFDTPENGNGVVLSPEVREFAEMMQLKLQVNAHKAEGWKTADSTHLLDLLKKNLRRAEDKLKKGEKTDFNEIGDFPVGETIDIGNYAMFLFWFWKDAAKNKNKIYNTRESFQKKDKDVVPNNPPTPAKTGT